MADYGANSKYGRTSQPSSLSVASRQPGPTHGPLSGHEGELVVDEGLREGRGVDVEENKVPQEFSPFLAEKGLNNKA